MEIKAPKGTKDIMSPEIFAWQYIEQEAHKLFRSYNYHEIRTPVFEHIELFQRSVGETTEIVSKQMYVFTDNSGNTLVLRPENTASVARALIDSNIFQSAVPKRYYYIGPMFRYEKMQKGRYRQFHQIGIEVFGEEHPAIDAEVIAIGYQYLNKIQCTNLQVEINSVGCRKCRPSYNKELEEAFRKCSSEICDDCKERLERNPLRILDCKNEQCAEMIKNAPLIINYLCEECKAHFDDVKFFLNRFAVPFILNPYLVRGLDYYTKTAFEIKSGTLGAQNAVLGGGRYDGLVKELEGPDVCGIGFAMGMERAILAMEKSGIPERQVDYFIVCLTDNAVPVGIDLGEELRKRGFICEVCYKPISIRSALRVANKINVKKAVLIGEEEVENYVLSIKDMVSGEQQTISRKDFFSSLGEVA
ncbi:MAG: histidine--tRNA ligase [Candidatus Fischerbacteria bacterium RBG_13_37_8]|uniref:Histidine--tRNA ligase n=1 Tax=Candidatus Fischerbacteria bacterium RBG_13_37_8 TaxID=1817863 RepID=A0A1F5VXP9_9BACT|nr:MAG: histidine--tRNA ligase [Candidatus Fischerbacteria bacterium RBG_13_37_8]